MCLDEKLNKLYDELYSVECPEPSKIPDYDNCEGCCNRWRCEEINEKIKKREEYLNFIHKN